MTQPKQQIMKVIVTLLFVIASFAAQAQIKIEGILTDPKGKPLSGANVYLDGTYDGVTTDEKGGFSFETAETGSQVLVITLMFFEDVRQAIIVGENTPHAFTMKESVNTLDAVVISAGTFQAGDNSKVTALKPLDIVTTAGSAGNIIAALNTLPGTQTVGESGRLFVRGGESDETQTFVDGLRVAQP